MTIESRPLASVNLPFTTSMNEKQKLIERMLELQRKFIAYERQQGVEPEHYFLPSIDHPLANYRKEHAELASRVIDIAHEEQGSKR